MRVKLNNNGNVRRYGKNLGDVVLLSSMEMDVIYFVMVSGERAGYLISCEFLLFCFSLFFLFHVGVCV